MTDGRNIDWFAVASVLLVLGFFTCLLTGHSNLALVFGVVNIPVWLTTRRRERMDKAAD